MMVQMISVIVCAKNNEKTIEKALKAIFSSPCPLPREVIVIDGCSKDRTVEICKRFPVKIVSDEGRGLAYARDLGWRISSGEFIAYCDADKEIEHMWFIKMLKALSKSNVAGVTDVPLVKCKSALDYMRCGYAWAFYYAHKVLERLLGNVMKIRTGNSMWKRKCLEEVGGFCPKFKGFGEDMDISVRLVRKGYSLLVSDAVNWCLDEPTLPERIRISIRQGRAVKLCVKMRGSSAFMPINRLFTLIVGIFMTPRVVIKTRSILSSLWPLWLMIITLAQLIGLIA